MSLTENFKVKEDERSPLCQYVFNNFAFFSSQPSFYILTVHIVLHLGVTKVTGHALYDRLLIGFAPRRSAKVNPSPVYDRKKLLTESGDAPISWLACLVAIVDRILAVADQKPSQ